MLNCLVSCLVIEFSDKKLKIKRKIAGLEPRISCVRDRDYATETQCNRADPYTETHSCLSDVSDFLNSLKSLNSIQFASFRENSNKLQKEPQCEGSNV